MTEHTSYPSANAKDTIPEAANESYFENSENHRNPLVLTERQKLVRNLFLSTGFAAALGLGAVYLVGNDTPVGDGGYSHKIICNDQRVKAGRVLSCIPAPIPVIGETGQSNNHSPDVEAIKKQLTPWLKSSIRGQEYVLGGKDKLFWMLGVVDFLARYALDQVNDEEKRQFHESMNYLINVKGDTRIQKDFENVVAAFDIYYKKREQAGRNKYKWSEIVRSDNVRTIQYNTLGKATGCTLKYGDECNSYHYRTDIHGNETGGTAADLGGGGLTAKEAKALEHALDAFIHDRLKFFTTWAHKIDGDAWHVHMQYKFRDPNKTHEKISFQSQHSDNFSRGWGHTVSLIKKKLDDWNIRLFPQSKAAQEVEQLKEGLQKIREEKGYEDYRNNNGEENREKAETSIWDMTISKMWNNIWEKYDRWRESSLIKLVRHEDGILFDTHTNEEILALLKRSDVNPKTARAILQAKLIHDPDWKLQLTPESLKLQRHLNLTQKSTFAALDRYFNAPFQIPGEKTYTTRAMIVFEQCVKWNVPFRLATTTIVNESFVRHYDTPVREELAETIDTLPSGEKSSNGGKVPPPAEVLKSHAGALGIMQLMPLNEDGFRKQDLLEEYNNLMRGVEMLARKIQSIETFFPDLTKSEVHTAAGQSYQMGEGNVRKLFKLKNNKGYPHFTGNAGELPALIQTNIDLGYPVGAAKEDSRDRLGTMHLILNKYLPEYLENKDHRERLEPLSIMSGEGFEYQSITDLLRRPHFLDTENTAQLIEELDDIMNQAPLNMKILREIKSFQTIISTSDWPENEPPDLTNIFSPVFLDRYDWTKFSVESISISHSSSAIADSNFPEIVVMVKNPQGYELQLRYNKEKETYKVFEEKDNQIFILNPDTFDATSAGKALQGKFEQGSLQDIGDIINAELQPFYESSQLLWEYVTEGKLIKRGEIRFFSGKNEYLACRPNGEIPKPPSRVFTSPTATITGTYEKNGQTHTNEFRGYALEIHDNENTALNIMYRETIEQKLISKMKIGDRGIFVSTAGHEGGPVLYYFEVLSDRSIKFIRKMPVAIGKNGTDSNAFLSGSNTTPAGVPMYFSLQDMDVMELGVRRKSGVNLGNVEINGAIRYIMSAFVHLHVYDGDTATFDKREMALHASAIEKLIFQAANEGKLSNGCVTGTNIDIHTLLSEIRDYLKNENTQQEKIPILVDDVDRSNELPQQYEVEPGVPDIPIVQIEASKANITPFPEMDKFGQKLRKPYYNQEEAKALYQKLKRRLKKAGKNSLGDFSLESTALRRFNSFMKEAKKLTGKQWHITSGGRTWDRQLKRVRKDTSGVLAAQPQNSDHLNFRTADFRANNAPVTMDDFEKILKMALLKGIFPTEFYGREQDRELWHWRIVGKEAALQMARYYASQTNADGSPKFPHLHSIVVEIDGKSPISVSTTAQKFPSQ